ncbi:Rid family hydrolase [Aestuariivirga sp.]|uniref:Rid family hydrolase n=1 Tax=Aestuariivirga sp. TaxID=2650926 RepID=UPI00359441EB
MKKQFAVPEDHWSWGPHLSHSHAVRCGRFVWVSGQMDLGPSGGINFPGDLRAQVNGAMTNVATVLAASGCDLSHVVKLLCFYVNDGSRDEDAVLQLIGDHLPPGLRPTVTAVPVAYLAFPGAEVMIEAYAMASENGDPLPRSHGDAVGLSPLPAAFASAVRCGKMIFVSGQSPVSASGEVLHKGDIVAQTHQVMAQVKSALASFGAAFADVVKINRWYVGQGKVEDFEPAAMACAANFAEPGPAATGVPIPRHARDGQLIRIEVVAMLSEDGSHLPRRQVWPDTLWDWTVDIPYWHGLKCHDMIFLGGQVSLDTKGIAVNPFDMRAQAAQAMVHIGSILRELGANYDDICKLTTVYAGPPGLDALQENLRIRSAFFKTPGPATTDIALPVLAYPGMIIEIDTFAMAEPDPL